MKIEITQIEGKAIISIGGEPYILTGIFKITDPYYFEVIATHSIEPVKKIHPIEKAPVKSPVKKVKFSAISHSLKIKELKEGSHRVPHIKFSKLKKTGDILANGLHPLHMREDLQNFLNEISDGSIRDTKSMCLLLRSYRNTISIGSSPRYVSSILSLAKQKGYTVGNPAKGSYIIKKPSQEKKILYPEAKP